MKDIKIKENNTSIKSLDKENNILHYEKENDIKVKPMQSNDNKNLDADEVDAKGYAIKKVVDQESITALSVINRGKKFTKEQLKKRKNKLSEISKKDLLFDSNTSKINIKDKKAVNLKITNSNQKKTNIYINPITKHNHKLYSFENVSHSNDYSSKMKHFMLNKHKNKIKNNINSKSIVKKGVKGAYKTISGSFAVVRKTVTGINNLISLGTGLILLIVISLFFGVFSALGDDSSTNAEFMPLSQEVIAYKSTIEKYAKKYEMEDFVALIQAVMMQESGGKGDDPMQSSECIYNVKYPKQPNGITNSEYSIDVGIHYLSDCFQKANVEDIFDTKNISLGLQGYNFGNGYISWALDNFGGYTRANAKVFSQDMMAKLQTDIYGDPEYVQHVMRYYHIGKGNIVLVAKTQIGNIGGEVYWRWYGYDHRVEWCACFVSWCASQSGELGTTIPKFSAVIDGIKWYKDTNRWKNKNYIPNSGDLIFFDWEGDGKADHVAIVEKIEGNNIHTIEGNSKDECRERVYSKSSKYIYGYGIIK